MVLKYFEDSFLKPGQVATLMDIFVAKARELGGNRQALAAFEMMHGLFEAALAKGAGLVSFGD